MASDSVRFRVSVRVMASDSVRFRVSVTVRVRYVSLFFVRWFFLVVSHGRSSGVNVKFQ